MRIRLSLFGILLLAGLLFGCGGKSVPGEDPDITAGNSLVLKAEGVVSDLLAQDKEGQLKELLSKAAGVVIVPDVTDVSFIVSFGGGAAVLMANTDAGWSGPVFLAKRKVGVGLQAGYTVRSGIFVFMHQDDVRYVAQTGAILSGQARLTVLSTDLKINETPEFYEAGAVYFVGQTDGMYAGMALSSGGYANRTVMNEKYTGVDGGGPRTILFERKAQPEGAASLRALLGGGAH